MTVVDDQTEISIPADEPLIIARRVFRATPELVYRACTEGRYLRRWWGPRRLAVVVCDIDLRVGGTWRIVHRAPDGAEFAFHGAFLELDPPRRRIGTFVYEGAPEHEAVETMDLAPVDGGTCMTMTTRHSSIGARDLHVANGMEHGMRESLARLDELVISEHHQGNEDPRKA